MRTALLSIVVLALAAQASALSLDFGLGGQVVAPGYQAYSLLAGNYTTDTQTFGSNVVTLTVGFDTSLGAPGPAVMFGISGRGYSGTDANLLDDAIRVQSSVNSQWNANNELQLPFVTIAITGLEALGQYDVDIGSWDNWSAGGAQRISAIGGTTGADVLYDRPYHTYWGAPLPTGKADVTGSGVFTADAQGVLSLKVAFDQANSNHFSQNPADPNDTNVYVYPSRVGSDPRVYLDFMDVTLVPEPATLGLLALGALGLLRRRK